MMRIADCAFEKLCTATSDPSEESESGAMTPPQAKSIHRCQCRMKHDIIRVPKMQPVAKVGRALTRLSNGSFELFINMWMHLEVT